MKILCLIDSLSSGGAQRQLVELAKGFKERNHEVSFIVYHNYNFFKPELDRHNIAVEPIIEPNYIKRLFKIRRAIRRNQPDAVLSFLEAANFMATVAGFPTRHWKLVVGERSANPEICKSIKLRLYRWFHLFSDYVVANSYENIKIVLKVNPLLPRVRTKVIYNIIDRSKWNNSGVRYEPLKNKKFKLIVVGSIRPIKNPIGLIEAVNLLSQQEKRKLLIDWYGKEHGSTTIKEAKALLEKYELKKVISFHAPVNDIHMKVAEYDGLGLFSFLEGLPNTVCEAMVMGKPIIASAVSDIPLLLQHKNEFMFNPNNIEEIRDAISNLLILSKEELMEIGNTNKNHAEDVLNKDAILDGYLELLKPDK